MNFSLASFVDPPQNPFLPREELPGPAFLDTSACLCALQKVPLDKDGLIAWKCIGDQNNSIQNATHGKWFHPRDKVEKIEGNIYDDSNGPEVDSAFYLDLNQQALVHEDDFKGNNTEIWDRECTAVNRTSFSTSFYRATKQKEQDETLVDAAPCWRPNAFPVNIQNASDWLSTGCSPGFLCQSPVNIRSY